MNKQTAKILEKVFIKHLDIKKKSLNKINQIDIATFDSLRYMSLISGIEKEFKIKLKKKHIFCLKSFNHILKILKSYKI